MKTKSFIFLFLGLVCFGLLIGMSALVGMRILLQPVTSSADARSISLEIPNGTSIREVAQKLKSEGLIRSEKFFYLVARYPVLIGRESAFVLKSGMYTLDSSMSLADFVSVLESGQQAYIKAVFPEGLTISKIASILEEDGICEAKKFMAVATDGVLLEEYNIPATSFEGFLFPDTYFFTPDMDAEKALRMMVDNFFDHIHSMPMLQEKSMDELFALVTLASIVEREYRVDSEAPLIASVFTNRINAGIGLYSCATIEYIITEIQGKPHPDVITYADLQIDNPYNTYRWRGLTPAPISNPGMVALQAAANPPKTDYFFFRLTDAAAGTHTFSKTFSAHTEAGVEYRTKKAAAR